MQYPKLKEWTKTIDPKMNLWQFGRSIYKYTDCGPWIKAILWDGREVYYEDEEATKIGPDHRIQAIVVGSIVEGWDGDGVGPIEVTNPKNLMEAINEINDAACSIWKEVNENEEYDDMLVGEIASGVYKSGGY